MITPCASTPLAARAVSHRGRIAALRTQVGWTHTQPAPYPLDHQPTRQTRKTAPLHLPSACFRKALVPDSARRHRLHPENPVPGPYHAGPPRARRQAEEVGTVGRSHTGRATLGDAMGEAPQAGLPTGCGDLPEVRRTGHGHRVYRRPAGDRADLESPGQARICPAVGGKSGASGSACWFASLNCEN